jgi:hypothetical protein
VWTAARVAQHLPPILSDEHPVAAARTQAQPIPAAIEARGLDVERDVRRSDVVVVDVVQSPRVTRLRRAHDDRSIVHEGIFVPAMPVLVTRA